MTRAEMVKRIAMQATLIQQNATTGRVEADASEPTLTKLLDAFWDGCKEFEDSHNWAWKDVGVELVLNPDGTGPYNIDSDPSRYLMPPQFEAVPSGEVFWKFGTSYGGVMAVRHASEVARARFMAPQETGEPEMIGGEFNRRVAPGLGQSGGIEIQIFPAPNQAYTAYFRSRLACVRLSDDNQTGHWPACHDLTVVAYGVRNLFLHDQEAGSDMRARADVEVARRQAISVERDNTDYRPDEVSSSFRTPRVSRRRVRLFNNVTGTYVSDGLDGL